MPWTYKPGYISFMAVINLAKSSPTFAVVQTFLKYKGNGGIRGDAERISANQDNLHRFTVRWAVLMGQNIDGRAFEFQQIPIVTVGGLCSWSFSNKFIFFAMSETQLSLQCFRSPSHPHPWVTRTSFFAPLNRLPSFVWTKLLKSPPTWPVFKFFHPITIGWWEFTP